MAKYKCIPAPVGITITKKNTIEDVAKTYEDLINQHASEGWKYHSQQDVLVTVQQGCLGSLAGGKDSTKAYKLFVFVNE